MTRSVRPRERTERLHRAASDRQAHISSEIEILRPERLANIGENLGAVNRAHPPTGRIALALAGRTAELPERRGRITAHRGHPFVAKIGGPSNNGVQLTRSARCGPFAYRSWGQSLKAALAADPGC